MSLVKRMVSALRLILHRGSWALVMVDKGERSAILISSGGGYLGGEQDAAHMDKLIWWIKRFQHTACRDNGTALD